MSNLNNNQPDVMSFNTDDYNNQSNYRNPFSNQSISEPEDINNQKINSNLSINTDSSTRPQTAVIFNQIIKSNHNNSSVEHHLSILNKIRNNKTSNLNESSKNLNESSKNLNKSIDIFNDGLNKSDSDSESDSEENVDFKITEDDLRFEFEKSINMKKINQENKLPDYGLNTGGNGIKSLKNLKYTNKTICTQCND